MGSPFLDQSEELTGLDTGMEFNVMNINEANHDMLRILSNTS